jgi:flagellar hook-associated protein 3 FlgL
MIFDAGRNAIQRQNAELLHTQQQIATGRRILTPSEDPIAASRALEVTQSQSANEQFQVNIGSARDALTGLESNLGAAGDILTYVRTRVLGAGNASLTPFDHELIAADLEAQFTALLGVANSQDATGEYSFAGYQSSQPAFAGGAAAPAAGPAAVVFDGDAGARSIQVGASRSMVVAEPGSRVFMVDATTGESQVFGWISDFIGELRKPSSDPTRDIGAAVSTALGNMDTALDNVLTVRASVGARMAELDSLEEFSSGQGVQYADTLARLQDLDYVEAISRLTQQQTVLEAAQQSYVRVTGLSLFNYLR